MSCERCAQLEEEVAYLKSELGIAQDGDAVLALKMRFGMTPNTARFLLRLYRANGRVVTRNVLEDTLMHVTETYEGYSDFTKVYAHRARNALGHDTLVTVRGVGYAMSPSGLKRIGDTIDAYKALRAC